MLGERGGFERHLLGKCRAREPVGSRACFGVAWAALGALGRSGSPRTRRAEDAERSKVSGERQPGERARRGAAPCPGPACRASGTALPRSHASPRMRGSRAPQIAGSYDTASAEEELRAAGRDIFSAETQGIWRSLGGVQAMKPRHTQGLRGAMSSLSIPPLPAFPSKQPCQNRCLPRTRLVHFLSSGLGLFFAVLQHEVRRADGEPCRALTLRQPAIEHPTSAWPDPA